MKKLTDEIKIGNIKLKNRLILAPMAGVSDLAFRSICAGYGASLVVSEMVSDHAYHYKNDKTFTLIKNDDTRPYSVQIFGSDINYLKELAIYLDKQDYVDIIDINMGCPVPKIAKKSKAGSYWLKDPDEVYNLVKNIVSSVKKPVTVKVRLGLDENNLNVLEIAKKIELAGAKAIAIHGRTVKQLYSGFASYDLIKKVKENVNIPVIANGDIKDYKTAKKVLEYTNCDALMIGRAAIGRPFLFKEIIEKEIGKDFYFDLDDLINLIKKHFNLMQKIYGEKTAILKFKMHISNYLKDKFNYKGIKKDFILTGDFNKLIISLENLSK